MLVLLLACSDRLHGPDWEGGTYLQIQGPIEGGVVEEPVQAALVWTWVVDDTVGASAELVPFEPIVGGYQLDVSHPPETPVGNLAAPADLTLLGRAVVVVGTVVLLTGAGTPELEVEPVPALSALLDGELPTPALRAGTHTVVGGWTEHRLGALGGTEVGVVADLPGWTGEPCPLEQLQSGLALYAIAADRCPWHAVAAPGSVDVLQDIPIQITP